MATNLIVAGGLALAGSFAGLKVYSHRAAALGRIAALDSCLAAANRQRAEAARVTLASIKLSVARNRNQAADARVAQQAQHIFSTTQALIDTLQQLRKGWPATGSPAALNRLKTQASQYAGFLQLYVPESSVLTDSTQASKQLGGLAGLDLQQIPSPAIGAALTRLETQVWQVAAEALEKQAEKIGSGCDLCFDKIGAYAAPVSDIVEPGALYEARLMLSTSGGVKMYMRANARELEVDPRLNQGLVSFRVPAAYPGQPDTARAQWRGQIRYNASGTDTMQQLTVPYYIVKRARL